MFLHPFVEEWIIGLFDVSLFGIGGPAHRTKSVPADSIIQKTGSMICMAAREFNR